MPAATRSRKQKVSAKPRSKQNVPLMQRSGTLSQWGNSLGVRIPQEAVDHLHLKAGEQIEVELLEDSITIRRKSLRKKWSLDQLLKGVTPEKVGGEFDWGGSVGKEFR